MNPHYDNPHEDDFTDFVDILKECPRIEQIIGDATMEIYDFEGQQALLITALGNPQSILVGYISSEKPEKLTDLFEVLDSNRFFIGHSSKTAANVTKKNYRYALHGKLITEKKFQEERRKFDIRESMRKEFPNK